MEKQLLDILKTMNVPEKRKTDYRWLLRNLGIQNGTHPQFPMAMDIIKKLVRKPMQTVSNEIRRVAGSIEDMKKVLEKDFKDLEKIPLNDWPKDRLEEFQKQVKKVNEDVRNSLIRKASPDQLLIMTNHGWVASIGLSKEEARQRLEKIPDIKIGHISEIGNAYGKKDEEIFTKCLQDGRAISKDMKWDPAEFIKRLK